MSDLFNCPRHTYCGRHSEGYTWRDCALCRSGRQGVSTLRRAQDRTVVWPQPQANIRAAEDPEIYTSLDDAFSAVYQFLKISTRKCNRYHHSHRPHPQDSSDQMHYLRYHTPNFTPISPSTSHHHRSHDVHVQALPGSYSITAVQHGNGGEKQARTVHTVKLEEGKTVSVTLDL